MTGRRAVLLAMLVYVTLDLSIPMMPGAFVFAPEDSVESIQGPRGRSVAESARAPVRAVDASIRTLPQVAIDHRRVSMRPIAPPLQRVVSRLPRATLISAPTPEDLPPPPLRLQ